MVLRVRSAHSPRAPSFRRDIFAAQARLIRFGTPIGGALMLGQRSGVESGVAKSVTRTWYRVALARPGAPQLVAASGEHMGHAIAEAVDHLTGSWPIAVEHATGADIPLGESVGKGH